jgi:hypothetical protein
VFQREAFAARAKLILPFAIAINYINLITPQLTSRHLSDNGGLQMLQQLWDSFIMLIPVFFLLTMIFGAGFYIGRVSKRDS